jgi:hypothetical protein
MSETKFTLGPWTCEGGLVNGLDSRPHHVGTPSLDIFDAGEWPYELNDEAMANAQLISAAPDMIDALRQWAAAEKMADEQELQNARQSRDLAIAKAIGDQP